MDPNWARQLLDIGVGVVHPPVYLDFAAVLNWGGPAYPGDYRFGKRRKLLLYSMLNILVGFSIIPKWWINLVFFLPNFLTLVFCK